MRCEAVWNESPSVNNSSAGHSWQHGASRGHRQVPPWCLALWHTLLATRWVSSHVPSPSLLSRQGCFSPGNLYNWSYWNQTERRRVLWPQPGGMVQAQCRDSRALICCQCCIPAVEEATEESVAFLQGSGCHSQKRSLAVLHPQAIDKKVVTCSRTR